MHFLVIVKSCFTLPLSTYVLKLQQTLKMKKKANTAPKIALKSEDLTCFGIKKALTQSFFVSKPTFPYGGAGETRTPVRSNFQFTFYMFSLFWFFIGSKRTNKPKPTTFCLCSLIRLE